LLGYTDLNDAKIFILNDPIVGLIFTKSINKIN